VSLKVFISGKLYDKADAKISVFDHGLLYGDGGFEGIRAYSGRVFRLKEHVDRLYESAQAIHLWLECIGVLHCQILDTAGIDSYTGCRLPARTAPASTSRAASAPGSVAPSRCPLTGSPRR